MIFGIFITIALETGIAVSVDTLYDDFIFDNRNQNYTDITVNPSMWVELPVLEDLSHNINGIPGVKQTSPVYYFNTAHFTERKFPSNVLIYGITSNHPDLAHINLIEGSRNLEGSSIIVSESIQSTFSLEVGQVIDISSYITGLNIVNVKIGGVMSDELTFGNKLGFLFILANVETLLVAIPSEIRQSLLSLEIDVSVDNLLNIKKIGERIEDSLDFEYYVFVEKDVSDIKVAGIRAYQTAMNLIILASFIVEFLFMTNILTISINDRQKEIGILRTVGTSSWQLIIIIGIEILIYAIIGSINGIFAGLGFSVFLVKFMDQYYTSIEFQAISFNLPSLLAIFLSGIMVALISGLYPIFLAKTAPVVQNIHSQARKTKSEEILKKPIWKYTISFGVMLSIVAFISQYYIGPSRFLDFSILSTHFISVAMIFLGTVLVEVGLLVFLPHIAMKVLFWVSTVTRIISLRNISREFKKSLFTIMTSAMALTFIIIIGSVSAAIIEEVPNYFQNQWGGIDVIAEARDDSLYPINSTVLLDSRPAIEKSAFIQEARSEIQSINGYIYGVDPGQYGYFAEPIMRYAIYQSFENLLNSSLQNTTHGIVSHLLYQRLNIPLGENISIKTAGNGTTNILLVAVIKANIFLGDGEYIYINTNHFQDFFNSTLAKWFVCKKKETIISVEASVRVVLPDVKEITQITSITKIIEKTLIFQAAILQVLFIESFILAAIAQFVCILISTLHMEREIGIMRSLGLSKDSVFSIFMSESTILGFTALIMGLIDGLLGSALLVWYISFSIPIKLKFMPERIIFWISVSFLITIASSIVPSFRSSRKTVVETILDRPMEKRKLKETEEFPYQTRMAIYPDMITDLKKEQEPSVFAPESFIKSRELRWADTQSRMSIYPSLITDQKKKQELSVFPPERDIKSRELGWYLIRVNRSKLQIIVFLIFAITVINYILDPYIVIKGIFPADFFVAGLINLISYNSYDLIEAFSISMNPILFFLGLALFTSICQSFRLNPQTHNLIVESLKNFILGLILMLTLCITWFILIIIIGFLFNFLQFLFLESNDMNEYQRIYYSRIFFDVSIIVVFIINIIFILLFQRIWAFLVYRGFNSDIPLEQQYDDSQKMASRGQLGFLILLFLHVWLQSLLNSILHAPVFKNEYIDMFTYRWGINPPLNPIALILLTSFEIGFFILLVLYQIIQFHKEGVSIIDGKKYF